MKLKFLGRQALMGVMAVALVAGASVQTFAAENLLNQVKERELLALFNKSGADGFRCHRFADKSGQ